MNELILEFLEYDKQQIALEQSMINAEAMLEQFDPELADMIYTHEAFEFIREAQEIENLSDLDKTIDRLIERPHATSFVKRIATVLAKIAGIAATGAIGAMHNINTRYKIRDTLNNLEKEKFDVYDKLDGVKINTSEYKELWDKRNELQDKWAEKYREGVDAQSKFWLHVLAGLGLGALSAALIYSGYKLYCYFVKKSAQKMLVSNGIDPKDKKATLQLLIQESEKLKSKLKTDEEKEKCEKTKQELEEMLSKIE